MHLDVEQTGILPLPHLRRLGHRRQQFPVLDDAQAPWTLADQHAPVRQKRHAPRRFQTRSDHLHLEGVLFRVDDDAVRLRHELRLGLHASGGGADITDELPNLRLGEHVLERDHLGLRNTVGDDGGHVLVGLHPDPHVIEEAGRAPTRDVEPMAAGAPLGVERGRRIPAPAAAAGLRRRGSARLLTWSRWILLCRRRSL